MTETIQKIEAAFRELSLTDPSAIGTYQNDFDQDKNARRVVDECVRQLDTEKANRLREEYFGCGAITPLIHRDDVTEIIINGRSSIWYETQGCLHRHDDEFFTELTFQNFIQRLSREAKSSGHP
jgi:Flp pilus assembly CpaF family ATPase